MPKQVKITLKYHPNECLGKPYEVLNMTGAVVVRMDLNMRGKRAEVRVTDRVTEEEAEFLANLHTVTVVG